jgi:nucleoside-diphosphate-sugar epimerase
MLKSYIVCPGLIYGCEETTFSEYFKYAWLQDPHKIPILGNEYFNAKNAGKNSIPTIHVHDLVSAIKRIADKKPSNRYIFAVDRSKNRQLKRIISAISKSVGNGLVEITEDNTKIPSYDYLNIDIRVKTSKIFDDVKGDEEEEEDFLKRCFKWHCEVYE